MKTIALGSKMSAHKKEHKLHWLKGKDLADFFPIKTWFIVTIILPAMVSSTLVFKNAASLENLVELYFESLVGSAILSLPVLAVCCFLYWCFSKLQMPSLLSRILFLCMLTAGVLAEVIFLQGKEVGDFVFSDLCFYVAAFAILVPGLAQAFKPND